MSKIKVAWLKELFVTNGNMKALVQICWANVEETADRTCHWVLPKQ